MPAVLLAGATGMIGRYVALQLDERGYTVRRLMRANAGPNDAEGDLLRPETLGPACRGVDAVISCAGASMKLGNWRDRDGFLDIDWRGNTSLIHAARKEGVGKFVYVSLAHGPALMRTEYASAHERAVEALIRSGLPHTIVRPTGIYGFFLEILRMARRNQGIVIGDGSARTNPIHEADAARACVEALDSPAPADMPVGGPIAYTRKEIVELAFQCLGKRPAVRHVPAWIFPPVTAMVRPINRRIAGLYEFGAAVTQSDCLAPAYGAERLDDYFRKAAECPSPQPPSTFSASSN